MNSMRADRLLNRVSETGDGDAAYELLQEFYDGYPVEHLRQLLRSEKPAVMDSGVFIASELGIRIRPLIAEFERLLSANSWSIRYESLECVFECANKEDGALLAKAIGLVGDPDRRVREKVLVVLSLASTEQLMAAQTFIDDPDLRDSIAWLASAGGSDDEQIRSKLADPSQVKRRLAAAAAAKRARPERKRGGLEVRGADTLPDSTTLWIAAASSDSEIVAFATSELRINGSAPE